MRISRLFIPAQIVAEETLILETDIAHYVRTVLRLKKGAEVTIFDGFGGEYAAKIQEISRKLVTLGVREKRDIDNESPLKIELALSVSRGERMDVAIQKATELGVAIISPVITQHCVVKLDADRRVQRHKHWQSIIYRACEQCGRNIPPLLNLAEPLVQWQQNCSISDKIIFEPAVQQTLKSYAKPAAEIAVLVGPEGGFSEQEVAAAKDSGFTELGFGPRVLRNETAAMASVAALQVLWGDMG